jgi:hypothetical protein
VFAALLIVSDARTAYPAAVPKSWKAPGWWHQQAACIRWHEARGDYSINTGNGHYGAYQFLLSTWQSVGGRGYPHQASRREQDYRAWLNWRRNGSSWGANRQWPNTARACGVW